jgi:Rrf2 family transcriptional regulator, nitric oxide-sensitive transcriptional repressor
MYLTLHTDYALRTLIFLAARNNDISTTNEVSEAYGISRNHLVRVVQTLARNGFLKVMPGRSGGMQLAVSPDKINIGKVFRAAEPSLKLVECFDPESNTCPIASVCGLQNIFGEAAVAFIQVLDRYTLQDVLKECGPHKYMELFKNYQHLIASNGRAAQRVPEDTH